MENDIELVAQLLQIVLQQRKENAEQRAEIRRLENILIEEYGWLKVDMS